MQNDFLSVILSVPLHERERDSKFVILLRANPEVQNRTPNFDFHTSPFN